MAATTESNPASGAGLELARVREEDFGTTPETPSLVGVRTQPFQIAPNAEAFISQEVNAQRVVKAIRQTYQGPSFNVGGELIYGNFDAFMECVMLNEWNTNSLTEGNVFLSETLEGSYSDAATAFFQQLKGCVFQSMSLNIDGSGNNPVQAQFSGIAKSWETATSSLDADGYDAAPANDPMIAAQCAIEIDDSAATLVSLSINVNPSMEALRAIGNTGPAFIAPNGNRAVTGQLVGYVDDRSWLQKIENESDVKIEAFLRDAASGYNEYHLTVGTAKVTNVQISQDSGPLRFTADWQAYSASGGSTLTIDRTDAA